MRSGMSLSGGSQKLMQQELGIGVAKKEQTRRSTVENECDQRGTRRRQIGSEARCADLPARVQASATVKHGEYDASRLRSQREVIRDVMLAAADCDTWLTLGELRALTHYGEASISAQLRHLRKLENGGYDVTKQRRDGAAPAGASADGRGEFAWEYRIGRILQAGLGETSSLPD